MLLATGDHMRETVGVTALSLNLAICWKHRVSRTTRTVTPEFHGRDMCSENVSGAVNQQERLAPHA